MRPWTDEAIPPDGGTPSITRHAIARHEPSLTESSSTSKLSMAPGDVVPCALVAVARLGQDYELPLAPNLHASDTLVLALNDPTGTQREAKGLAALG